MVRSTHVMGGGLEPTFAGFFSTTVISASSPLPETAKSASTRLLTSLACQRNSHSKIKPICCGPRVCTARVPRSPSSMKPRHTCVCYTVFDDAALLLGHVGRAEVLGGDPSTSADIGVGMTAPDAAAPVASPSTLRQSRSARRRRASSSVWWWV